MDTPGFGDIGGVEKDNEIIQQFEEFFRTTMEIDYILVTVQSGITRWSYSKQYVYDTTICLKSKYSENKYLYIFIKKTIAKQLYFKYNKNSGLLSQHIKSSGKEPVWKNG